MKLRKTRTTARQTPAYDGENGTPTDAFASRKNRSTSFGLFDTFRKSSAARVVAVDEDELRLLKKGSYTHSEKTEPTEALTVPSETMSVASEEINSALNKTFAVFQSSSDNQAGQEIPFVNGFLTLQREDEGQFTNLHQQTLNQATLDRLAAIETATHFSDPKNIQLRTTSLKITEIHADTRQKYDDENIIQKLEMEGPEDENEAQDVESQQSDDGTYDPDKYLLENDDQPRDPPVTFPNDFVHGATRELRDEIVPTLSGGRTPSPNEEYFSDSSSEADEEPQVIAAVGKESEAVTLSPLRSPTGSTSSTSTSDWEKGSTGNNSREVSLLDAAFEQEEREPEDADEETLDDTDGGSTVDLDDEDVCSVDGDAAGDGPASPVSQGSSAILEEFEELDALAAFSGIFTNLMACNFSDLSANILVDDEDDYSLIEGDNPTMATNGATVEPAKRTAGLKSVADRMPTPPAPRPTSFWSMFGCSV